MRYRFLVAAVLFAAPVFAAETVTYTYDALGRLTVSASNGSVNNGVQGSLSYDPAGNRTNYAVAGAAGGGTSPPPTNQPPVPGNDTSSGVCNTTKIINVVANDTDPEGNVPLALVSVTPGTNTGATVSNSTSLAVTGYYRGTEYIYYVVRDSLGATATGRLTYTTTGSDAQCFQ